MRASLARAAVGVARSPTVLALGVYLAVALAMTAPALLGRRTLGPYTAMDCCDGMFKLDPPPPRPYAEDPTAVVQDYPRERLFARGLRSGRVPAWNPLVGAGAPLWAEQGGPFFPLKLPIYVAPDVTGIDVFLMLRLVVAALGARALARARGRGAPAALAAGLLFEVSGVMVAQLSFVVAGGLCVLPWAAYGAHRLAAGAWRAGVVASAIALAAAFHAGHPPIGLCVWLGFAVALAAHAAAKLFARRRGEAGRIVAGGAIAGLLGAALAAPVLLPLLELDGEALSYKETSAGTWAWQLTRNKNGAMLPISLLAPSAYHEYRRPGVALWPWPYSPALGVVALVLAVAALPFAVDVGLLAMGVLGVIVSTGPPGLGWVHELPGLSYILPFYGWGLLVLPLTQAAAHMVELLQQRRVRIAAAATLGVAALAAWIVLPLVHDHMLPGIPLGRMLAEAMADPAVRVRAFAPYGVAAAMLVLAWAASRTRAGRHAGLAVVLVAAAEALSNDVRVVGEARSQVLAGPPPPPARFLQDGLADGQGRVHVLPFTTARPHLLSIYDIPDLRYSGPLPLSRLTDYFAAIRPPDKYFVMHLPATISSPLLDLAAVRFVVLNAGEARLHPDDAMVSAYADANVTIYRNGAALPRARVARSVFPVADRDAALVHVRQLAAQPGHADAATPIALEPSADGRAAARLAGASGEVRIVDASDPDRLVLAADLAAPGYVVVADAYDAGWRASVDGAEAPIHPANLLFRAVPVPAGRHDVVLAYRPTGVRVGAGVFLAGLAGTLGVGLWRRRA